MCDDPSLCYGYGATTAPVGNWHNALNAYLDQVRVAGKQNFYNGQSPVVAPTNRDFLDRTDGWMDEGFISYKGWKLSAIDMPQYASALNKFTMFYAVNPDAAVRHFYFASALLSDGYFFYAPASTQWFAEYGTYFGNPVGQAYQMQGLLGVWARDYTAGKVIVNPTSAAVTVNAPGYIDSSGNPTSQISINANDGVVLTSSKPLTSVFVKGMDGALWWKRGAEAWQSLGGYLTSSPAAVSWGNGRIDVFVHGGDNALWHMSPRERLVQLAIPRRAARAQHRTGRELMGCRAARPLCRRHEQRPLSHVRRERLVQLAIPRRLPHLLTGCRLLG